MRYQKPHPRRRTKYKEVVIALVAIAFSATVLSAANQKDTFLIVAPFDDAYTAVLRAMNATGWTVSYSNRSDGIVNAQRMTGSNPILYTVNLNVLVIQKESQTDERVAEVVVTFGTAQLLDSPEVTASKFIKQFRIALQEHVPVLWHDMQQPEITEEAKELDTKATVYIYRASALWGKALEPSVFCDEVKVADMDNGRYFALRLESGRHVIRSYNNNSVVDLDFEAGNAYFIKVSVYSGFGHVNAKLVDAREARRQIQKLKPLSPRKVADASHVVLDPIK